MSSRAASTRASVVARGVKTRPGAVRNSRPWKVVCIRIAAVADWAAHYRREGERYTDGESRLPATEDSDARQRQLTRMGNAAAGAGLALVMQGRGGEAHEWFDRACDRYRESWEHAPPGSWGRPIGMLKARVLAEDWEGAERDARWTLDEGAAGADSPIGRYAAALAFAVARRVGRSARGRG